MLVFLFSSLAIRAVGSAAGEIIEEVRRQFREDPGIMAGTVAPRLRPRRGHHGPRCARGDDRARACWPSACRSSSAWSSACIGGATRRTQAGLAGLLIVGTIARHHDGDRAEQQRWRLGQRKKFIEAGG